MAVNRQQVSGGGSNGRERTASQAFCMQIEVTTSGDVNVREFGEGENKNTLVEFRACHHRAFKSRDGTMKHRDVWFTCQIWNREGIAEVLGESSRQVLLTVQELRVDHWDHKTAQNSDGSPVQQTSDPILVIERLRFMDGFRPTQEEGQQTAQPASKAPSSPQLDPKILAEALKMVQLAEVKAATKPKGGKGKQQAEPASTGRMIELDPSDIPY